MSESFDMSEIELEVEVTGILNASSEKREMGHCKHCGQYTLMLNRKIYKYNDERWVMSELIKNKGEPEEPHEELEWLIQECIVCKKLTLRERRFHFDFGDSSHCWLEDNVLYPATRTPSNSLPNPVKKVYENALKVKTDPKSFALLAGQTLEAACWYEQAQGENFYEELEDLAQKGKIPKKLAKMGQQIRLYRNKAAHDAEDEVTEEDIPIILEFLEAILEYLYIAPAKIEAVRKRLDKNSRQEQDELGYL